MSGGAGFQLRPYQLEAVAELSSVVAVGERRLLLVAPTGSGKTAMLVEYVRQRIAEGQRVLFLAHTREIIKQTSRKLSAHNLDHGIILAGLNGDPDQPVQVASVQTITARAMRTDKMPLPPAQLLVIDEAHHCPARTYQAIIKEYPHAVLIGATATPCRGDGRGLGTIFQRIVECPQVAELIVQKHLVKTLVYAPVDPDLRGVETRNGDYVETQLADRVDRDDLVGDIVSHWLRFGQDRQTVCFAVNVQHSLHICNEFNKAGVKAEHVDGATPKRERDAILARLESSETKLVVNCMVLTEGWDMPEVGCIILGRPTKKMGLYRQMVGRVLRPAPDKFNAIVLDHSGATFRHGFVEDFVTWTLDPDKKAEAPQHVSRQSGPAASRMVECKACSAMRIGGEPCPNCGWMPKLPPDAIIFSEGELGLVGRDGEVRSFSDPHVRIYWHAMLAFIAEDRGYKPGWVTYKYREKFGEWPPYGVTVEPVEPSREVLSWVRSRNIAWAKAKQKAAA